MAVLKPEENKEEIKSVERLFPKVMRTNEIKNEINDIKIWGSKIKEKYLKYETKNYIYGFQQYDTEKSFGDSIYTGNINRDEGDIDQTNLLKNWKEFNQKSRPRTNKDGDKKDKYF